MNKKILTRFLILSIVSLYLGIGFFVFYTLPNESFDKYGNLSYKLDLVYKNYHPEFNYLNGLYMMFFGIFFFSILVLLELPDLRIRFKLIEKIIKERKRN